MKSRLTQFKSRLSRVLKWFKKHRPLVALTVLGAILAAGYSLVHFLTPHKLRPKVKNTKFLDKVKTLKKNRLVGTGLDLLLVLALITFSLWRVFFAYAADPCPVTDGGAGDGDSTVNGVILISSNTTWTATAGALGVVDCTGVDITVDAGVTLTLDPAEDGDTDYTEDYAFTLQTDNLTVDGTISANNNGYEGGDSDLGHNDGRGPGGSEGSGNVNKGGSGGSYGGSGASGTSTTPGSTYGTDQEPTALGSGGGCGYQCTAGGGNGGGAIKLEIVGTLAVDGSITANGGSASGSWKAGGGSGGSIWIVSNILNGNGLITANGGAGHTGDSSAKAGGGGGGRIRITAQTDVFIGGVTAIGGTGAAGFFGEKGTIYLGRKAYCPIIDGGSDDADSTEDGTITIGTNTTWYASYATNGIYDCNGYDLLVDTGSTLTLVPYDDYDTNFNDDYGVTIYSDNLTVDGTISANGQGYIGGDEDDGISYGRGPGGGEGSGSASKGGSGGSHGGLGGNGTNTSAGPVNGDNVSPTNLGSGGGCGYQCTSGGADGGGAIKLVSTNTTTINGTISANGNNASGWKSGGGSGGSVWIVANDLAGSTGSVSATGGTGHNGDGSAKGGAGGGGRIAFHLTGTNNYSGSTSVIGGQSPAGYEGASGSLETLYLPSISNTYQFKTDNTTQIATGSATAELGINIRMDVSDADTSDTLTPEIELRPIDTPFKNKTTHTGTGTAHTGGDNQLTLSITDTDSSGASGSGGGSPATGEKLVDNTSYHWQARVCDQYGLCSTWTQFGDNNEGETDFSTQRLVGYWSMDEGSGQDVNDRSGNGNDGTRGANSGSASDDPTWKTQSDCKINGCLSFDGGSDYIDVTNNSSLDLTSNLTLSAWVQVASNWDSNSGDYHMIASRADSNNRYALRVYERATDPDVYLEFSIKSDGTAYGNNRYVIPDDWANGEWKHVAGVLEGTTAKLYINGVKVDEFSANAPQTNSSDLYIGESPEATSTHVPWNGLIDEVKIYADALTEDEILTEYANGGINFGAGTDEAADIADGAGNPPVAHWNFDEGQGTTASDISGNENDGTLGSDGAGTDIPTWADVLQPPSFAGGLGGKALEFDGSGDHIGAGPVTQLEAGLSELTVCAWIYPNTISGDHELVRKLNGSSTGQFLLRQTGDDIVFGIRTSAYSTHTTTANIISNQTWQYVCGVYGNGNISVYHNGSFISQTPKTGNLDTDQDSLIIGCHDNDGNGNCDSVMYNGYIDDVKIYDYARTPAQIAYDMNRGAPIAWWKMDDNVSGNGATIVDHSGNGNNGTTDDGANDIGMDCTVEGKRNLGCDFDGVDDYVDLGSSNMLDSYSTGTITAWFKGDSGDIFSYTDTASDSYFYLLRVNASGEIYSWIRDAVSNDDYRYAATLNLNNSEWHHVAAVHNGVQTKIYYDGKDTGAVVDLDDGGSANAQTWWDTIGATAERSTIGALRRTSDSAFFNGLIDDVRIYNYALSPAQIAKIMNDGSVRFGPQEGSP